MNQTVYGYLLKPAFNKLRTTQIEILFVCCLAFFRIHDWPRTLPTTTLPSSQFTCNEDVCISECIPANVKIISSSFYSFFSLENIQFEPFFFCVKIQRFMVGWKSMNWLVHTCSAARSWGGVFSAGASSPGWTAALCGGWQ